MSIEAMKQALEALQNSKPSNADGMLNAEAMNELWHAHYAAIDALRTAMQQAEVDPRNVYPNDLVRFAALVAAAVREADQRAFWEACRPHGKAGEVIYTTYKHIRTRNNE